MSFQWYVKTSWLLEWLWNPWCCHQVQSYQNHWQIMGTMNLVEYRRLHLNGGRTYTIPIPDHGTGMASMYRWLVFPMRKTLDEDTAHSVRMVWPTCERASAWMLRKPGRWTGMSLMSILLQNLRWIIRWVSLNDLVPPYLMMYDTTMALSHIRHTTRDHVEAGTLLLSGALPPSLIDWWAGLPTAWTTSVAAHGSPAVPPSVAGDIYKECSLSLTHSMRSPAALQGRVTKPPDGEWSGWLKSCLTRTLSPDTKPLMPITGLCGGRADLSALGWP